LQNRPLLLIQARVRPGVLREFYRWYWTEHVPHVLAIPGIEDHRLIHWLGAPRRDAPNLMSVFAFHDERVIEQAMRSREATLARGDWERWAAEVRGLTVQIYGSLDVRDSLRHLS
jgi:hypothetical protein